MRQRDDCDHLMLKDIRKVRQTTIGEILKTDPSPKDTEKKLKRLQNAETCNMIARGTICCEPKARSQFNMTAVFSPKCYAHYKSVR